MIFEKEFRAKFNSKFLILKELIGLRSVVDVGCGKLSILYGLNLDVYSVGIDFYKPYLQESKKRKIHNKYILKDITNPLPFQDKSFDAVICTEVLEHLDKEKGFKVIGEIERIAKNKIILTTPNGSTTGLTVSKYDTPKEKHISKWNTRDFQERGFRVYGLNGFKFLRTSAGNIKYKPEILFKFFSVMSRIIAYYFPKTAYQLYAIKIK